MKKPARRLWFGDWQRDDASTSGPATGLDPGDTFVLTPDDDEDAPPADAPRRHVRLGVVTLLAVALLFALGLAVSNGRDGQRVASEPPQPSPTQPPQVQPTVPQPQIPQGTPPSGFGGADLTGPEAERAAGAALAKYPGNVERVTRGPTGSGYIVHVFQSDGNEVHVLVGPDFRVQGSDAGRAPRNNIAPGTSQ